MKNIKNGKNKCYIFFKKNKNDISRYLSLKPYHVDSYNNSTAKRFVFFFFLISVLFDNNIIISRSYFADYNIYYFSTIKQYNKTLTIFL